LVETADLAIDSIRPGLIVLRRIDRRVVDSLASSIRSNGLLQPIMVRRVGSYYEVVFGHHRLEACRLLAWRCIRAVVKDMGQDECFLTQVVENLQRNVQINTLSAEGYVNLIDDGWTIDKIAKRIGKSDSYVSDRIALVRRLHPAIVRRFNEDRSNSLLTPSHLELLARVRSLDFQLCLSHLVESKRLSVRKLEKLISNREPFNSVVEASGNALHIALPREVVSRMNLAAGAPVNIFVNSRKRMTIEAAGVPNSFDKRNSETGNVIASNLNLSEESQESNVMGEAEPHEVPVAGTKYIRECEAQ
jgi:ParB/RepB/Spo0J family partition protein